MCTLLAILQATTIFFILLRIVVDTTAEDDTQCLKLFKNSVEDPGNYLSGWNFNNGSICSFVGVQCWNPQENKVLSLKLEYAGLSGSIPSGLLVDCASMTSLSLAGNRFSGVIPSDICMQVPFVTSLDLSRNSFGGPIPDNLVNCTYLNALQLDHNNLTGTIPWGIALLPRLTKLDLSSNLLTGVIPSSFTNRTSINQPPFDASSFQDNPGLCGPPLSTACDG